MKTLICLPGIFVLVALSSAASLVRAQDGPPPPDAQYAPPPPPTSDDQNAMGGAPPPDQGGPQDQGAAGDQGGGDDQGASFQTFYDQLGQEGTWIQTDDYGYVFQPNLTDPSWAPYTDGHWVYTDDGWTWVSDEPWGWATYHYGRWCNIDGTGWVWVPGYRWAPAWVSWRYGGGYCGWAPLPPETFVGVEFGEPGVVIGAGFHFGGDVDVNFNIGPGCYNFVPIGFMGERNYRGHYLSRDRNYVVINNTRNITNINVDDARRSGNFRGIAVGGPPLAQVNAQSHQRIQSLRLTAANQPGRANLQGNSLAVYAPRVNGATVRQARPPTVGQTLSHPTFNRGDSIAKPLDVTSHVRGQAPTADAIQAAQQASQHAPATAKIATPNTTPRTHFTQPLTSMEPVVSTHRTQGAPGAVVHPNANAVAPTGNQPAASSAFTGQPNHTQQHPIVNPAYSGQATPQVGNQPEQHRVEHPAGASSNTGGQAKPTPTYHPQTQVAPAETHQRQVQAPPTQVYHPQSQFAPTETHQPQVQSQTAPTFHAPPAEVVHPQSEAVHPAGGAPPQAVHAPSQGGGAPHPQGGGGGGAQSHPQPAAKAAPAAAQPQPQQH